MTDDEKKKREELLDKIENWLVSIIRNQIVNSDETDALNQINRREEIVNYIDDWMKND